MAESSTNSLGLDFNNLSVKDTAEPAQILADESQAPEKQSVGVASKEVKEKKRPYVNPERVRTGGAQRVRNYRTVYTLCPVNCFPGETQ
jgi:hypothetical protein